MGVVTQVVDLAPDRCFDHWVKEVWIAGGGLGAARIIEEGDPTSRAGCVRGVAGGIVEAILVAERGKFVEYTVRSGPFPVRYHRGRVDFQAQGGSSSTLVTWTCSYTPVFCLGPIVSQVIKISFRTMLGHLAKSAHPEQPQS